MSTLSIALYAFAAILFFYIIYNVAKTREFSVGDAISTLGIVISLVFAKPSPPQESTITSTPTSFTVPTVTLVPTTTVTKAPTSTPEAIYTPIGSDIPLVKRVIREEQFGDLTSSNFKLFGKTELSSNGLILWTSGTISSDFRVKDGNGYMLLFRTKPKTTFYITFEWGPWNDSSFRAFWLANGTLYGVWRGSKLVDSQYLNFQYQPETWYYLLMWVDKDTIEGKIWERDHPETNKRFSVQTGNEFIDTQLNYTVIVPSDGSFGSGSSPNVPSNNIEIHEFEELEFLK